MENDNGGMDNENNFNDQQNPIGEDELAFRRNQVLMFGVVLLGILAICLAVAMPSDLEFNDSAIPSNGPMETGGDDSPIPAIMMKNLTNSTRKSYFKNPEDSVENKILRNIAIQKAIKRMSENLSRRSKKNGVDTDDYNNNNIKTDEDNDEKTAEQDAEKTRVDQIVQAFEDSEDFEDFVIDVEINDAIKKLRKEKGYKKRDNTIFDDLFKQIERQFLGDDPEEVRLIRRVGEEMEKRAREVIIERKKNRGEETTYEEELIAGELYLDYESKYEDSILGSGSGNQYIEETADNNKDNGNNKKII